MSRRQVGSGSRRLYRRRGGARCRRLAAVVVGLISLTGTAAELPKVVVLTTGGTIASRDANPMLDGATLVRAVPALREHARIEVEEVLRIGSSQITPADWLMLRARVADRLAGPDVAGVVITHGTDTLEETAFFLYLTLPADKPVVLVGAMRGADEPSPDGPANLLNAVRVAVAPETAGRGVLAVLDETVLAGRDLRKVHNRRVGAFTGAEPGPVGVVEPDAVVYYRPPQRARAPFTLPDEAALPRVALVADYSGFDAALLRFYLAQDFDGLVVETFAGGRASAGVRAVLREAGGSLPVVIASRVPEGRIVGRRDYGPATVTAADLRANKARILLMLALAETRDPQRLQEHFDRY